MKHKPFSFLVNFAFALALPPPGALGVLGLVTFPQAKAVDGIHPSLTPILTAIYLDAAYFSLYTGGITGGVGPAHVATSAFGLGVT